MNRCQLIAAAALLASAPAAQAQMVIRTPTVILPPPPPPPVQTFKPILPQVSQPQCFEVLERDGQVYRTRTVCIR